MPRPIFSRECFLVEEFRVQGVGCLGFRVRSQRRHFKTTWVSHMIAVMGNRTKPFPFLLALGFIRAAKGFLVVSSVRDSMFGMEGLSGLIIRASLEAKHL